MRRNATATNAMRVTCLSLLLPIPIVLCPSPALPQSAPLGWLDQGPPTTPQGVTFGVPWPKGEVKNAAALSLTAGGGSLPVQSWPLAFWPDGSIKWTGHAVVAGPDTPGTLRLGPGRAALPQPAVRVSRHSDHLEIDTGALRSVVPLAGPALLTALRVGGREVAREARLVALLEDRSRQATDGILREERFESAIRSVTVEQDGPVRAVVKIEGVHRSTSASRTWLPFVVRLYFFAGLEHVRMIHSFVFDGDQEQDFIRGLGVRFSVPLRDEFHNRHVRLAGESTGLFAEPVRSISGRRSMRPDLYASQLAGQALPALAELAGRENVEHLAVWDGFKLTQISADSFSIQKRTGAASAWIQAAAGRRSLGLGYVGDTTGGLAVGMRDFWKLAPTGIEIEEAGGDTAELTLWLWSPDAPAMDLRHYDTQGHDLEASYEDWQEGFSTAHGVARTTELVLRPFAATPANDALLTLARSAAQPPRLVSTPEYYHSIPVFGVWSLPDRSTPGKRWIEDQLDRALAYYQGQVEDRRWYGFWDFGDVMHSYDSQRHAWRYDVGGFAWANTELMPDLWLWLSFLRTGRADVFRMAEAMTRHTQEVDVYHLGRFQGLGSRHNVRHWGCGAKEVRISQALLKRPFYYLTADERTGDLMQEVVDADFRTVEVDPLRHLEPKTEYPTHARVGPDWFAFVSNWLAAWERTGDTRRRDKMIVGMKCLAAMPKKLFSGPSYGYDPATGKLYRIHDEVAIPHLAALMGGPELMMELTPLLDLPEWSDAWLHYCRTLQAPKEEQLETLGAEIRNGRGPSYARMTAYAARAQGDRRLATRAWEEFLRPPFFGRPQPQFVAKRIEGPSVPVSVDEAPGVSTNGTAQWSLNAIELLELVGDALPQDDPAWREDPATKSP
jgi:hypothetical protein